MTRTPDFDELRAAAKVVRVPLRVPFRGVTDRLAVILAGPVGTGEFAPFAEYGPAEASWWLDAAVEAGWLGWPAPVRETVGVNAIVPALDPAGAAALAAEAADQGARTVKIKVAERGGSLDQDADRVAAVREVFDGAIRIDANAAWTVDEAVAAVRRLDRVAGGLEYVEQPCPELLELAAVRRQVGVPIAADESIRKADDPVRAARAAAVDVVVVKVPPLGGVAAALQVIEAAGVPAVVSSALDTSVGLAAGLALALALPTSLDCGLGTGVLLAADLTDPPLVPRRGILRAGDTTGAPDPRLIAQAADRVGAQEQAAVLERMRLAWEAGAARRRQ